MITLYISQEILPTRAHVNAIERLLVAILYNSIYSNMIMTPYVTVRDRSYNSTLHYSIFNNVAHDSDMIDQFIYCGL